MKIIITFIFYLVRFSCIGQTLSIETGPILTLTKQQVRLVYRYIIT